MQVAAMILGILGGLFGLSIGMFGAGLGSLASAAGDSGGSGLAIVSLLIPIAGLIGGALVKVNHVIAGVLMGLSVLGMGALFGVHMFTAIPLALSGVGSLLAFLSGNEAAPKKA